MDRVNQLMIEERSNCSIAEKYSRQRVNKIAQFWGILPGMSLDLTCADEDDGLPWDFSKQSKRDKAEQLIESGKTLLLIGSPMCSAVSQLQKIDKIKAPAEVKKRKIEEGRRHLEFCCKL